eukprot:6165763-Amphidinium_carterae.1
MNLVPANSIQREISAASTSTNCLQRGMPCSLSKKVWGPSVGLLDRGWTYVASTIVPMGWLSACGIVQQIHPQMLLLPAPVGAQAPPETEVRRDMPLP